MGRHASQTRPDLLVTVRSNFRPKPPDQLKLPKGIDHRRLASCVGDRVGDILSQSYCGSSTAAAKHWAAVGYGAAISCRLQPRPLTTPCSRFLGGGAPSVCAVYPNTYLQRERMAPRRRVCQRSIGNARHDVARNSTQRRAGSRWSPVRTQALRRCLNSRVLMDRGCKPLRNQCTGALLGSCPSTRGLVITLRSCYVIHHAHHRLLGAGLLGKYGRNILLP